jgi:hypothetical protein
MSFLFFLLCDLRLNWMRRLVNSRLKSSKLAIAVILATFFVNRLALAEGYTVEFAVEVGDRQDGGSVKCQFDRLCIVTAEKLRLNFDVSVSRDDPDRALLNVDGDSGCCLLEGAVRTLAVETDQPRLRLRLFVGQPAKCLEFIENQYVGSLYLKFQFSRSLNKRVDINGNY